MTGKRNWDNGCKEAANLFKKLGRGDGFDAMFAFRFS